MVWSISNFMKIIEFCVKTGSMWADIKTGKSYMAQDHFYPHLLPKMFMEALETTNNLMKGFHKRLPNSGNFVRLRFVSLLYDRRSLINSEDTNDDQNTILWRT